jgi:hypothetical protein
VYKLRRSCRIQADVVRVFVELRSRLHDLVTRYGLLETLDRRQFHDSIDDALADIVRPARSG